MDKKWTRIVFSILVLAALLTSGMTVFAQPLDNGSDVMIAVLSEDNTGRYDFKFDVSGEKTTGQAKAKENQSQTVNSN